MTASVYSWRPKKIFQRGNLSGRGAAGVEKSGEWGGGISLPSRLGSLGERRKLPSGVRGGVQAKINLGHF